MFDHLMLVHDDDAWAYCPICQARERSWSRGQGCISWVTDWLSPTNASFERSNRHRSSSHVCNSTPMSHIIFQCRYVRCNSCIFQWWVSLFSNLQFGRKHSPLLSRLLQILPLWQGLLQGILRSTHQCRKSLVSIQPSSETCCEAKKVPNNEVKWNCRESSWKRCYKSK